MPSIPPAGFSPASAYTLIGRAAAPKPKAIVADKIDPVTGDYLSILESATIADGMVITLLRTQRGSGASVLELGQRFREVRHVTSETPELVEALAREALQPARDAGVARFESVQAEGEPGDGRQINAGIEYTDLLAPPRDARRSFTFSE